MRSIIIPACLILALAGCASDPGPIASPAICGSWRHADGATLSCEDTGLMVLQRSGPKERPIVGTYTFDGDQATFREQLGAGDCSDATGTYTLRVRDDAFEAIAVRDACVTRRKTLEGAWTRTGPCRVTPGS
jgi:hypothetical protein